MALDPELLGLLGRCKEHPEDDVPRLILADWLEDHGEPERADFVRAQVRLARGRAGVDVRLQLRARRKGLWRRHGRAWLGPWAGAAGSGWFARGLLHGEVSARRLPALADALRDSDALPWLESLTVSLRGEGLAAVLGCPL